jgi:ribonuclease HI
MTIPIRLWTSASHHTAFRCGGWACAWVAGGQAAGLAGGERNTTPARMALTGLVSGLAALPAGADVAVHITSAELAAFAGFLAALPAQAGAPEEDLDLWARILTAAKGRRLSVTRAAVSPAAPTSFTAAWADLAMDKAKATGAFTSAIPRPNLAKAPGLAA